MEDSKIFDLVEKNLMIKWREELEKEEENGLGKLMRESGASLTATLNEKQSELLKDFEISVNNYLDGIYYEICKKLFHFGLEAGMQLQQAFLREKV